MMEWKPAKEIVGFFEEERGVIAQRGAELPNEVIHIGQPIAISCLVFEFHA
jgi:hypothetical protein